MWRMKDFFIRLCKSIDVLTVFYVTVRKTKRKEKKKNNDGNSFLINKTKYGFPSLLDINGIMSKASERVIRLV